MFSSPCPEKSSPLHTPALSSSSVRNLSTPADTEIKCRDRDLHSSPNPVRLGVLCCVWLVTELHHLLDMNSSLLLYSFTRILVFSLFCQSLIIPYIPHDTGPQATLPRPLCHLNDPNGFLQTQDARDDRLREIRAVRNQHECVIFGKEKKRENILHTLLVSPPFHFCPGCWRELRLAPAVLYAAQ